jgi:hypothetical protein
VRIRTTTRTAASPHPISMTTPTQSSVHSGHRWAPSPAVVVYDALTTAPHDLSAELAPDIANTISLAALRHPANPDGQVRA